MQIIFFNINHARTDQNGILEFLNEQRRSTSIFCLQEVPDTEGATIDKLLSDFTKIIVSKYVTGLGVYRLATYIKRNLKVKDTRILMQEYPLIPPAIYSEIECNNKSIHILNFHGNFIPGDKLDSPERLKVSREIVNLFDGLQGLKIIGGDFNLLPETKSLEILERAGYINLIKEYGIESTRNEVSWKLYQNSKQYFADYVFINKEIKVESFEVPYSEVSDHLSLILNFDENS